MTGEEFAASLGVARRTVASWHARPEVVLRADMQRVLDTAYERAPAAARARFAHHMNQHLPAPEAGQGQALTVAIAIVVKAGHVLLVCRRDAETAGITWQFVAGVVKPGASPELAAVRETLAETGIHCTVRAHLGSRVHPVTGVLCDYYVCDYLAGDATNRDPDENVSVIWAPRSSLTRFIPPEQIYAPVLDAIEEDHERPA
ncbi:NUDIX hydrolase [Planotetraspora sp. A-T 1434]|uniref:NUDIX hydrolase n=1 Tax=Planotetraspora sp. A-T 1434 TaxID=2979219 RepID=UPI0021C20A2D|nr:NUDIX hydrolase [Planotetraspora sp. A-T 1434]MCT9932482.1 NUDIX hydrolase [Planotetraspora sp. A-T 1434]